MIDDFKHRIAIQVRFSDIDRLNHVNNACYHNYTELGRVKYFNEVLSGLIDWDVQGFILARTEIDHAEPVYLEDTVHCYTRVEAIGNKSITMRTLITRAIPDGEAVAAEIKGILVAMDYAAKESIPVPREWRDRFTAFEGI